MNPSLYVDNGFGDEELKENIPISFSLNESENTHTSSFYSQEFHLKKLLLLLKESRNTINNTHLTFTFMIFFTIT